MQRRIPYLAPLREQPPDDVTLPHPQSRQNHHRKEDKPDEVSEIRERLERTVDVADDGDGKDDVNPANDRALSGFPHVGDSPREVSIRRGFLGLEAQAELRAVRSSRWVSSARSH